MPTPAHRQGRTSHQSSAFEAQQHLAPPLPPPTLSHLLAAFPRSLVVALRSKTDQTGVMRWAKDTQHAAKNAREFHAENLRRMLLDMLDCDLL